MTSAVQKILREADAVCFDVDSTVIIEEGIDELAKFCNKGAAIADLTSTAMDGNLTFREALKLRLEILQPSIGQIREFLRTKPPTLTPGVKHLIQLLHSRKIAVYLISGGFRCSITPIADQLNIPHENVYANKLKFYFTGEYAGFDETQPTSKNGGKAEVIRILKGEFGYKTVVMIGDGTTDMEASPPAEAFIGYGGNAIRERVKKEAKWFVTDFNEIINVLTG